MNVLYCLNIHVELEETRCPASWTEFGGDCYRFFDVSKTFDESETNCQSYINNHDQPAHLASITCDEENEFVTELIASSSGIDAQRTWIGGSDRDQEGTFEWTDNKVQEYSNWNVNQPDNAQNEDCIEINFKNLGAWNDLPCSQTFPSICKMPVYDPMTACQALAEQINKLVGECREAVPSRK
ncbi:alpha-N-acetylgalactosamine-specific lectin-like [Asterias rubens]|uniref:alpha-N-acetylgalactosamine-specific lectin-like n=1 Tax=Asterias rubens TaxID=7604 RepID=UPI0014555E69|nr:alpha-N-acetylgalactosamine-specific lectin-like [Asterias rubens]